MIRYSNRFKAGTRKNKRFAAKNGPDRHLGLERDYYNCGFTKEPCSARINPGKPQHELRYHNIAQVTEVVQGHKKVVYGKVETEDVSDKV